MDGGAGIATASGARAVDAALAAVLAVAAWQGYRRGAVVALAGVATFALAAWFVAARAGELQSWAVRTGLLGRLAAVLEPVVGAWLPPEVAAAPVRPVELLRVLDALAQLPLPPEVREQWADALRAAARAAGPGSTLGELLARVVAATLLADLGLYALPMAAGLFFAAVARRLTALLGATGLGAWNRALGLVAGALEGALVAAGLLVTARYLAGLAPGLVDPAWWQALDQSRLAPILLGAWQALGPGSVTP